MCPLESLDRGPLSMGDLSMTIGHVCLPNGSFKLWLMRMGQMGQLGFCDTVGRKSLLSGKFGQGLHQIGWPCAVLGARDGQGMMVSISID